MSPAGDTKGRLRWRQDETPGRYYLKDPKESRRDIVVSPWGNSPGRTLWWARRRMSDGVRHEDPPGFGGTRRRAVDNLLDIEEVVESWR